MKIYHLQIICPYIPASKQYFDKKDEAIKFYVNHFLRHFPFEEALTRYSWEYIEELMENGYSLIEIDTRFLKNFRKIFLERDKKEVQSIRPRRKKNGSDELQAVDGSGDSEGLIRSEVSEDGDDDNEHDSSSEGCIEVGLPSGAKV